MLIFYFHGRYFDFILKLIPETKRGICSSKLVFCCCKTGSTTQDSASGKLKRNAGDTIKAHARLLGCEDLLVKPHPRTSRIVSLSTTQVREMAQQFSQRLPEKVFSPAEI
jgi:hypothetical protein